MKDKPYKYITGVMIMKNEKSIQELSNIIKGYMGKDIVITTIDRLQVFDKVDISINDKIIILESENEDNMIEFTFNNIEELYIDEIDTFQGKEIHIVFLYEGKRYSMLNLV